MNRKLLLTLLAFTAMSQAYAQFPVLAKYSSAPESKHDRQHLTIILSAQAGTNTAAKTTTQKKRLIAYSYVAAGTLQDSTHYYYSGSRGSSHPHLTSYHDQYSPTDYNYIYGGHTYNQQLIKYDSSLRWSEDINMALVNKRTYTYDIQDRPTSLKDSNTMWYYSKTDMSYDASGTLSSYITYDTMGGTQLIPKMQFYIHYDAQGRRMLDSGVSLTGPLPQVKVVYTYDNNGNMLSRVYNNLTLGNWTPYFRYDYLYDNSKRLVRFTSGYDFMGSFVYSMKDSFEYTGTGTQVTTFSNFFWNFNDSEWVPDTREIDVYNAQGFVDTYYLHKWNGIFYDTMERDVVVYDADGLVQYTEGYAYNGGGVYNSAPYDKQTMYYETYIDLDVPDLHAQTELSVYPNPATSELTIRRAGDGAATATIYAGDGRMVQRSSLKRSVEMLGISSLPAGNYFLIVKDQKTQTRYRKQFIKL